MGKKGQVEISFSMIVSIMLIVAAIVVSGYAISFFLGLGKCTEIGLLYNEMQKKVDNVEDIANDFFVGKVPSGVEKVCFGNLSLPIAYGSKEEHDFILRYGKRDKNVFLYPSYKSCEIGMSYYSLKNTAIKEFFCVPVNNGKIKIKLVKEFRDNLVRVCAEDGVC